MVNLMYSLAEAVKSTKTATDKEFSLSVNSAKLIFGSREMISVATKLISLATELIFYRMEITFVPTAKMQVNSFVFTGTALLK